MSLLRRYVAAVKRQLPTHLQDDVGRDLSSSLADALDALESASGQPLSDDEIAAVLKRRGHPMQVAAGYHSERTLISPRTFLLYGQVLKAALALVSAGVFAQAVLGGNGLSGLWHALHDVYWLALSLFAWVTVGFFFLDSWIARGNFFQKWNPARLRPVPTDEIPASAFDSTAEIVVGVLLLSFIESGLVISGRWFHVDAPLSIDIAPISQSWVVLLTAAIALAIGIAALNIVDRYWTRSKLIPFAAAHVVLGVCLCILTLQPDTIALTTTAADVVGLHADSLLYTIRFLVVLAALRSLYAAALAAQRFRRLSWSDERPPTR